MPFCSHCGKKVSEGSNFCPNCGQQLKKGFTSDKRQEKGGTSPSPYQYPYGVVPPWAREGNQHHPLLEEPKVVSTEKVVCRRISSEVHTALVLIHEDGTRKVKCTGGCFSCPYGDVE